MKLKAYKCPNCGANIDPSTNRCDYCGTIFKAEYDPSIDDYRIIRLETYQNPVHEYCAAVVVPDRELETDIEDKAKYAINELSYKLAGAIAENMEIDIEEDFSRTFGKVHKIIGRIKIVEPKYRT